MFFKRSKFDPSEVMREDEEEALAVLQDMETGVEYYLSVIDRFSFKGQLYVAFFTNSVEAKHTDPELILLRLVSGNGQAGNTVYESIRDKRELDQVFDAFFERYTKTF